MVGEGRARQQSSGWQRRGRGSDSRAYRVPRRLQHPGLLRVGVRRWPTNCFSRCAIRAVSCVLLLRRARGPRVACRAGSARARTARLCCPGGRSMECAPSQLRSFRTRTSFRNVHPWLCGARLGRAWSTDVAGVEFPAPPSRGHVTREPEFGHFPIQSSLTSEACDTRQGARHGCPTSGYV